MHEILDTLGKADWAVLGGIVSMLVALVMSLVQLLMRQPRG